MPTVGDFLARYEEESANIHLFDATADFVTLSEAVVKAFYVEQGIPYGDEQVRTKISQDTPLGEKSSRLFAEFTAWLDSRKTPEPDTTTSNLAPRTPTTQVEIGMEDGEEFEEVEPCSGPNLELGRANAELAESGFVNGWEMRVARHFADPAHAETFIHLVKFQRE